MTTDLQHLRLMANYNQWMNAKLYDAARRLTSTELLANRQAFFGSILGTLNHLAVGDTIWLQRFATHPAHPAALEPVRRLPRPASLDAMLFMDLPSLTDYRALLDQAISAWVEAMSEADLAHVLVYANTKGVVSRKQFSSLVVHFFNHQTHHRGQVTTLLSQAGVDVGVTDLLALIPNEAEPVQ